MKHVCWSKEGKCNPLVPSLVLILQFHIHIVCTWHGGYSTNMLTLSLRFPVPYSLTPTLWQSASQWNKDTDTPLKLARTSIPNISPKTFFLPFHHKKTLKSNFLKNMLTLLLFPKRDDRIWLQFGFNVFVKTIQEPDPKSSLKTFNTPLWLK